MSEAVTVIGLGNMGSVLAKLLVEGGLEVTVWNRTPAKADILAKEGTTVMTSSTSSSSRHGRWRGSAWAS